MEIIKRKPAKAAGLTRYFTGKPCGRGHVCERLTSSHACVECSKITQKQNYPKRQLGRAAKGWDKKYYHKDQRKHLWKNARNRAKKSGDPFYITADFLQMPEVCPVLGLKLGIGNGGFDPCSSSVDRIVGEFGYTEGNVQVISMRANKLKSDAEQEELFLVALRAFGPHGKYRFMKLIEKYLE